MNAILRKKNGGDLCAITRDNRVICWYGKGREDLLIADLCNQNEKSKSNIHNYQSPKKNGVEIKDQNSYLAGADEVRIVELEVFRVQFN